MLSAQKEAYLDIREPGHPAPDDVVAWRCVAGAIQVATEARQLRQTGFQRWSRGPLPAMAWSESIQKIDLQRREREGRSSIAGRAVDHGQPEDAPAQDAECGEQVDQTLGSAQLRLFRAAARFKDLVEGLDLPAQRVPAELLDGVGARVNRKVGDEFPVDAVTTAGLAALRGVQHGKLERRITALLANGRQSPNPSELEFENGHRRCTVSIEHFHAVHSAAARLGHLRRDRVRAMAGQAIDAGAEQKMRSGVLGRAKQFVDVAFAVADVATSVGCAEQAGRLPQIVQPPDTLFLLDRHPRRVDMLLQGVSIMELFSGLKLDRRQTEWQSLRRHRQARMHQDAASSVVTRSSLVIGTGDTDTCLAHRLNVFPFVRELGGVVKHKNRASRRCCSIAGRLKVAGENLSLVDSIVVEKSVRGFGVRPVLASERNTLAGTRREPLEQRSETLAEPLVPKIAVGKFSINPSVTRLRVGNALPSARSNMFARHAAPRGSRTRSVRIS